jgi:hypothetical protein
MTEIGNYANCIKKLKETQWKVGEAGKRGLIYEKNL